MLAELDQEDYNMDEQTKKWLIIGGLVVAALGVACAIKCKCWGCCDKSAEKKPEEKKSA